MFEMRYEKKRILLKEGIMFKMYHNMFVCVYCNSILQAFNINVDIFH